jgi:nicotinic acid phosphoribosyltransferase
MYYESVDVIYYTLWGNSWWELIVNGQLAAAAPPTYDDKNTHAIGDWVATSLGTKLRKATEEEREKKLHEMGVREREEREARAERLGLGIMEPRKKVDLTELIHADDPPPTFQ